VPTFTAFAVNRLLEGHFPDLVDLQFTARMEQSLDDIAEGKERWLPYLNKFYLGKTGLETQVNEKTQTIDPREIYAVALDDLHARVRIGRFGPYLEQQNNGDTVRISLPEDLAPGDLRPQAALALLQKKEEGPNCLGVHPQSGQPVYLRSGRFGPYVQLGEDVGNGTKPKRASLLKDMRPESVTLEMAVALLSLPRPLGAHPETNQVVEAGMGRFGPYVRHGEEFRSLAPEDDVLTIGLTRALELLSQPKGRRGARKAPEALRALGAHPTDGEPVILMSGRYGPYVTHGGVNATLPRGTDPSAITLEKAVSLLAVRASKAPVKRTAQVKTGGSKGKSAARKPATRAKRKAPKRT
jgi:DNA topoisomerase-1